jgi:hypothetical protein
VDRTRRRRATPVADREATTSAAETATARWPELGPLGRREARAIEAESNGILALRANEPTAAVAWFGRAVRTWDEQGLTVWQARAEGLRADALEAAGRRASARASRQRADAILVALESPLRTMPQ